MKLKALVNDDAPGRLVQALNKIRPNFMERVVGHHLHRPDFLPVDAHVQNCDFVDSETHQPPMCDVTLTKVSVAMDRSEQDFLNAHKALVELFKEVIEENLPVGQKLFLRVTITLDERQKHLGTLLEVDGSPILVEGKLEDSS